MLPALHGWNTDSLLSLKSLYGDLQLFSSPLCLGKILLCAYLNVNFFNEFFGILVDESKEACHKEQIALVLRYVNKEG